MHTFHIQPDFDKLRTNFKHLTDQQFEDQTESYTANGNIVISEIMEEAEGVKVESSFRDLIEKHDLVAHQDNLFYLTILHHEAMEERYQTIHFDYISKKRVKELAELLLLIKETPDHKPINISASTLTDKVSIKDQYLSRWIVKLIAEAVERQELPLGIASTSIEQLFGTDAPFQNQNLDTDRLRQATNCRIVKPTKATKKLLAKFCLSLHPYLQEHTHLRAEEGITFSDAQLNFYYDFLNIFHLLDIDRITSEPQDYMRSLLRNYLNSRI